MRVAVATFLRALAGLAVVVGVSGGVPAAEAQDVATEAVTGRVLTAGTKRPLAGATVLLEEQPALVVESNADGSFRIDNVPVGNYHLLATAPGYLAIRIELLVGTATPPQEILLNEELHYTEVVSVSGTPRDQFIAVQPTSVLAGQDLTIQLAGSLGTALQNQPGLSERSFGPATSRPVIRGLDGDRVVVLEDGVRTGDLSSQSGDHGVSVNPAAATRLEIVRGPAALMYGASAIGGLINVIHEQIPLRPQAGTSGNALVDFATAAGDGGGAADINVGNGRWAFRAGGAGRVSGDVATPLGDVANTQSRSGMGHVGVSATRPSGYVGASYAYSDMKYGVPFIEDGLVELTPRRHSLTLRGERRDLSGFVAGIRGGAAYRRYRHEELVAADPETRFKNDSLEFDVLAHHRPYGRLEGTFGAWGLTRAFESIGAEALSPPVDQRGAALFLFEELTWSHVSLLFGARYDRNDYSVESDGLPDRAFDNMSTSVGLLVRPTEETTIALSLARAGRSPALEELYYFGPHPGNFAFEIGNPDLRSEKAIGLDVSLRWRLPRSSGEFTYFRNDIRDFVFRRPVSEEEFDARFGEPEEDEGEHAHGEFPIVEYVGADSVLQGIEAHADVNLTSTVVVELAMDYTRGSLKDTHQPLPRMPPFRFIGGLRYQFSGLQIGGAVTAVPAQRRLYEGETLTEGYELLKLYGAYSFLTGGVVNTVTVRLDNATNTLYRNHLSLIKEAVPEMGRNLKLLYGVKF
jgi:iron complex outermembrane receptor protein